MSATTEAEIAALKELVASDGWRVFLQMVDAEWGAEQVLARQEAALADVERGNQDAINDTVQQIQNTRKAVYALLSRVNQRIGQLAQAKKPWRPFAPHRRIG